MAWKILVKYAPCVIFPVFSRDRRLALARPMDRCSRINVQKTRYDLEMCLLGVKITTIQFWGTSGQGCARDQTLAAETETRPRRSKICPRRDRDETS